MFSTERQDSPIWQFNLLDPSDPDSHDMLDTPKLVSRHNSGSGQNTGPLPDKDTSSSTFVTFAAIEQRLAASMSMGTGWDLSRLRQDRQASASATVSLHASQRLTTLASSLHRNRVDWSISEEQARKAVPSEAESG